MPTLDADNIMFSCISGYNYYTTSKSHAGGIIHVPSETDVTFVKFPQVDTASIEKKWRHFVAWPADTRYFIWPTDLARDFENDYVFVFRKKAYPKYQPFKNLLFNDSILDWQRADIKRLAYNFLKAMSALHGAGYAYHAFDYNNMYYHTETMDVVIRFSTSMSRYYGHPDNNRMITPYICKELKETGVVWSETSLASEVAIEFLPPWVDYSKKEGMTLNDDYYSIAAVLFRMFIGRMPYQGAIMIRNEMADIMNGDRDQDEGEHQRMFEYYHKNPVFIFDPEDTRNRIGVFSHEQKFAKRWEALPIAVRKLFSDALTPPKENVDNWMTKRYEPRKLVSAETWLSTLQREKVI